MHNYTAFSHFYTSLHKFLFFAYNTIKQEYEYLLTDNQGNEIEELKGSLVYPILGVSKKASLLRTGSSIVISKEETW